MGLFDAYDADPEDLPTFSAADPGNYEAVIASVEETEDVYKQGAEKHGVLEKFITFTYDAEDINYQVTHHFPLPRPRPWDPEKIEYNKVTEEQAMLQRLGALSRHLENCGIPKAAQKNLDLSDLSDMVGISGVLTMKRNKKGYVNPEKFVQKQSSGTSLPETPAVSPDLANWS